MRCSAAEAASAWASVFATMNFGPSRPDAIMLLMALPPPPPTPITTMRGFRGARLGACASLMTRSSEALPQPLADTPEVAGTLGCAAGAPAIEAHAGLEGDGN